jgi:hypothetical protein
MFLQSIGLLPDNIVILSSSRDRTEKRILEKLKILDPHSKSLPLMVKESVDQYDLNIKAVRAIFNGFYSELNADEKSKELILEDLAKILKFKNRTSSARKPPRILLLGPPCRFLFLFRL